MKTTEPKALFNSQNLYDAAKELARVSMAEFGESICIELDSAIQTHEHLCSLEKTYEKEFRQLTPRPLSPGLIMDGLVSDDPEIVEKALADFRAIMKV